MMLDNEGFWALKRLNIVNIIPYPTVTCEVLYLKVT